MLLLASWAKEPHAWVFPFDDGMELFQLWISEIQAASQHCNNSL